MATIKTLPAISTNALNKTVMSLVSLKKWRSPLLVALFTASTTHAIAEPTELDCLVKPETSIELSSAIDTVVDEVLVKPGDRVEKGQVLVQLEQDIEKARVKLAHLQAVSKTEINDRQTQLNFARKTHKRMDNLFKKKMTSERELDQANIELRLAQIALNKALEKQKLAQVSLELAEAQLALKTLLSPIDGIVVDIYTRKGESVADRSIMRLAQINPLKVELIAPTEYFGLIQPGMTVDIQPERPVDTVLQTTVSTVDPLIDPASGTFTVRMSLPNSDNHLVGGVNCVARFDLTTPPPITRPDMDEKPVDLIDIGEDEN